MTALHSLQVLVVDDNPNMRSIIIAVLNSAGIRSIREVADGAAALEALNSAPADLAIVDFKMFPLDGVAFTRLVRNSPESRNPYLPIIMMTGHSDRTRVQEARDAGVTEFIVKPVTAKALLARVQSIIFRPRVFVRSDSYFGPCRRRSNGEGYTGPLRRSTDQPGPGSSAA